MKFLKNLLIVFLFLAAQISNSQDQGKWSDYWEKPLDIVSTESSHSHDVPGLFNSAALVWIRIYQKGISSQDLPSCVFHPSCSRFAFGAIEQYGTIRGILLAGDRLLRCNPFAHNYYLFDGEKFSDPIYRYSTQKNK